MPRRTARLLACAATAVALAATSATPSLAQSPGLADVTVESTSLTVTDGPDDEFTDVMIDVDTYVPSTASTATPAPVVVLAHGFGGSKAGYADLATAFAQRGYIAVAYSARGFGQSSHEIGLDSIHYDVKDARQLMDAIAARDDVLLDGPGDPRIGWFGDSYGGGITLQVATSDDRVDVIAPRITWSSLVYALSPNNLGGIDDSPYDGTIGFFKQQWTSLFFGVGTGQPITDNDGLPSLPPTSECLGFVSGLCETYLRIVAQGRGDDAARDLLAESSPDVRHDRLEVPTFVIQGQADTLFNMRDAVRNYEAARANDAPVKMLWFNGGHSGPNAPGEVENDATPDDVVTTRLFAWFDRHLRGDTSVDTGPGFEWFRDWVEYSGNAQPAYDSAPAYPAIPSTDWTLSGDGALVGPGGTPTAGTLSFVNPPAGAATSYSETAAVQDQDGSPPPSDAPGTFVAFTTPPFAVDTELVGLPELSVPISSQTGEVAFFAKVYDVAPDGSKTLPRRLVAPVWAAGDELADGLDVLMPGFVHRFPAGHQLQLVLAATDASYANRRVPDQYTVTLGDGQVGTLSLPLRAIAAPTAPAPGSTTTTDGAPAPAPAAPQTLPQTGGGAALAAVALAAGAATLRRRRD